MRLKAETDVVLMVEINNMNKKRQKLVLESEEDEDREENIFIL